MISARRGFYENVKLLLDSGADCRSKRYDTKEDAYTIVRKLSFPKGRGGTAVDISPALAKNVLQLLESSKCK
jgi:hypothetical protein